MNDKHEFIKTYNINLEKVAAQLRGQTLITRCNKQVKITKIRLFQFSYEITAEIEGKGEIVETQGDALFTPSMRDWYDCGCHLDSRYNKTILHLTETDNLFNLSARLQQGSRVHTVILPNQI